jgi:arsenate reductase-like glutaredoxin family protein
MRDSAIFYRSFYEAIDNLPSRSQKEQVYSAIFDFIFKNIEPQLKGNSLSVWILVKPQLIANQMRYENGSRSKTQANRKQNVSESQANKNVFNKNENKNENVLMETDPPAREDFLSFCQGLDIDFEKLKETIEEKYNTWIKNGWKDGNGKQIDDWQQKIKNTLPYLKPMPKKQTNNDIVKAKGNWGGKNAK